MGISGQPHTEGESRPMRTTDDSISRSGVMTVGRVLTALVMLCMVAVTLGLRTYIYPNLAEVYNDFEIQLSGVVLFLFENVSALTYSIVILSVLAALWVIASRRPWRAIIFAWILAAVIVIVLLVTALLMYVPLASAATAPPAGGP